MTPQGVDSVAWMQQLGGRLDQLNSRTQIESALDDLEYPIHAHDPELHGPAYELAEQLRSRLEQTER